MPAPSARCQSGQSLLELAVSIAIGILILAMTVKAGKVLLQLVQGRLG